MSILRTKDFDLSRKEHESRLDENANDMDAMNDRMAVLCVSKPAPAPSQFTFSDFLELKDQYYEDRFGDRAPSLLTMTGEYMRIINWSLAYFYGGASSWRQRYQYACAPYASDLTACDQAQLWIFQDKQPKPFDHLFAILPANCMHLLPKCYASLAQEDGYMDAEVVESMTRHLADSLTEAERARNTWNVPSRYTFLRGKKVSECVNVSIHSNRVSALHRRSDRKTIADRRDFFSVHGFKDDRRESVPPEQEPLGLGSVFISAIGVHGKHFSGLIRATAIGNCPHTYIIVMIGKNGGYGRQR